MGLILLVVLLIFLVPAFLAMRKQRRQQQEVQQFQMNLEVGEKVLTAAGMYGTVTQLNGAQVTVEIAPGVNTKWERMAIMRPAAEPTKPAETEEPEGSESVDLEESERSL